MNNRSYIPLIILIVCACVLITAAAMYLGLGRSDRRDFGSPVAKPLMTAREEAMMDVLEILLPAYRIHAQVAMGALLRPSGQTARGIRHIGRNVFSQKIVDFVVQDPTTGKIVALIEVDDRSHRVDCDQKRDAMTAKAGYHTLRIPASAKPTVAQVMPFVSEIRENSFSIHRQL